MVIVLCVCVCVCVPNFEKVGSILLSACPFVCSFVRLSVRSKKFKARVFEISYIDFSSKNSLPVFFSCPNYLPLPSYAPLKG